MAFAGPNSHNALKPETVRHIATLYKITRTDGTVFRFTDHNSPLSFGGQTFAPGGGAQFTAAEKQSGLQSGNTDSIGVLDDANITEDDLRAGLYDRADVITYLVDWRYPWAGAMLESHYMIETVDYEETMWRAALATKARRLQQRVGRTYTRDCQWVLGDSNCGINVPAITVAGEITSINTQRSRFRIDLSPAVNQLYRYGMVVWTSGANDGLSFEVRNHTLPVGDEQIELFENTPYDMVVGDEFTVHPGCARSKNHCRGTTGSGGRPWTNNIAKFGGFPDLPGTDELLITAGTRT